jgi:hypothetical protein
LQFLCPFLRCLIRLILPWCFPTVLPRCIPFITDLIVDIARFCWCYIGMEKFPFYSPVMLVLPIFYPVVCLSCVLALTCIFWLIHYFSFNTKLTPWIGLAHLGTVYWNIYIFAVNIMKKYDELCSLYGINTVVFCAQPAFNLNFVRRSRCHTNLTLHKIFGVPNIQVIR